MSKYKQMLSKIGRFMAMVLLIAITFSYAMFQGGFVSWFLFYTLIPFLLFSLVLTFIPIQIKEVGREITPSRLSRGDKATVTIHFKNATLFPLAFLTVRELGLNSDVVEKSKGCSNLYFVGWKRRFHWTYEIPELERGEIQFSTLQFTFTDFFGWTVRHKFVTEKQSMLVYPKLLNIKYRQLPKQFDQGGVLSPYAFVKDTSMVTSVRDYQAGDRFSWIHWKSFAKNETLRTKDFEERQSEETVIVVDATTKKHFEEVIELSASVLHAIVKNHGDVSFFIAGDNEKFYPKIKSHGEWEEVMRQLAVVEASDTENIDFILTKEQMKLESSMILFTGELTDSLKNYFMHHSKWMKGIICYVVTTQEEFERTQIKSQYFNVKIIPITKERFSDVFTEVIKP